MGLGERLSIRRGLTYVPQHRRLQSAEAEIHPSRNLGGQQSRAGLFRRVAVRVRQTGHRKVDRPIVPVFRQLVDYRSPWIRQTHQLGDLVVRLSRRVITRPSDQAISARLRDEVEAGVPARNHQHGGRQRQFAVPEREGFDVTCQMVHWNHRYAPREREGFGKRNAHQQ